MTGYSVALPDDTSRDGRPIWYGAGKLAADLTWPKIRQRWTSGGPDDAFTAQEPAAIWEHAARSAGDAAAQIHMLALTDPAAASDAAWAAADTLHVAAAALKSRVLRQAADSYQRGARAQYGRIPRPSPAGNSLRRAARLIGAYAFVSGDRSVEPALLIIRLAALAEAVAALREAQQLTAQAASARAAAEALHAAAGRPGPDRPALTATAVATTSFPLPPQPARRSKPDLAPRPARRPAGRGPRQPRHRRP